MEEETVNAEERRNARPTAFKKTLVGLIIVLFLATSWVGAQQFAQSAVSSPNFTAPYVTTWFATSWMIFCFPCYCIFAFIFLSKEDFLHSYNLSYHLFEAQKYRFKDIFTKILPFNALWILVNYLYVYSLAFIATTDASAILSTNIAFVYVLSFILLREVVYMLRVLASLLCITGVILFGYADGFQKGSNLAAGVVMALFSALGSAAYKVLFKRVIYEGRLGQVSFFLTLLGTTNVVFMWIFFLPLYYSGVESLVFSAIPWSFLCASAALSVVFNFLVNFGVAYTYPLFVSIGFLVGIPLNAAALLIVSGFGIMIFPESWNIRLHHKLGIKWSCCYPTEAILLNEEVEQIHDNGNTDLNKDQ